MYETTGTNTAMNMSLNVKIKILEVYDSTITAIYYKGDDPNIKLKVGDIVFY